MCILEFDYYISEKKDHTLRMEYFKPDFVQVILSKFNDLPYHKQNLFQNTE